MKPHLDWHHSTLGRFLLFIGGLRFAIPVMVLVAAALIVGTFLDAGQGAKVAARLVYGSGWFIALMALVCMSLIAAVLTRYPWNRRHIGFITVHTGLIILIVGSFWSLFGRIEGQVQLREGQTSGELEMDVQRLKLMEPDGATVVASVSAEDHVLGGVTLGGVDVEIVDRWANTTQEQWVADDGATPLRAFEIAFDNNPSVWIGEAAKAGGPANVRGLTIRVLDPGAAWTPPPERPAGKAGEADGYAFVVDGKRYPLGEEGEQAFPGWTITKIGRFRSAIVSAGGLAENPSGGENPAVEVVISDGKGTSERHTAFEKFPDMVLKKTIEGDAASGAQLHTGGKSGGGGGEELVLFGPDGALRAAFIAPGGEVSRFSHDGSLPWVFRAGGRTIRVLESRTHARQSVRFVEAPAASDNFRPALVVSINGGEPTPLAWKSSLMVPGSDRILRFGPRRVRLPFRITLKDFRKKDYPGTMMAMAYESDVVINSPAHTDEQLTIYMNHPFKYKDWKVYQSGYLGDTVSIFSVMRDPGLPTIYTGCVVLCVGILVTFYGRSFSRGHPGIGRAAKTTGDES